MKKGFNFIIILMILILSTSSFAAKNENDNSFISHTEYLKLKDEGTIGKDVSYEDLKELYERSVKLEKEIEESTKRSEFSRLSNVSLKARDVLISNGTSSFGILGHAGIALSSNKILHIANPDSKVTIISPSTWESLYKNKGWTKVYRSTNSVARGNSASWTGIAYTNSKAKYSLTMDLTSLDPTYCSKIVWQGYYYRWNFPIRYKKGPPKGSFLTWYTNHLTYFKMRWCKVWISSH